MTSFATRLKQCMDDRSTFAAELARRAGISSASVSDWVNGKTQADKVKAEPLLRAAAFLQVNPMWLLTGRGARESHSATGLHAAEAHARYAVWPFRFIDAALVRQLRSDELVLLEGAWLNSAKGLGFSLGKPAAA